MAKILILGPSQWWDKTNDPESSSPFEVRKRLQGLLVPRHEAILLEEQPDVSSLSDKFAHQLNDPLLTDVLVYWPPKSRMVTTQQEIAVLVARRPPHIRVWLLHHTSVASVDEGAFEITQHGDRGRYTSDIIKLAPRVLPWNDEKELDAHVLNLRSLLK